MEFDFAVAEGAAAAAGLAGVAGEAFDFAGWSVGFESGDDDDGFAAALGFFAPEDDAAVFAGWFGVGWGDRFGGA